MLFSGGMYSPNMNTTRIPVFISSEHIGVSTKNLVHWCQMVRSGGFNQFDYGFFGNMKRYDSRVPRPYPLEKVDATNIILLSSKADEFATPEDIKILKARIKGKLMEDYVVPSSNWMHMDFFLGKATGQLVNSKILDFLQRHQ